MRLGLVGQDRIRVRTDTELPLNTWVHVAGTFDGSQVRLYINGNLEETQAASGALRHNDEGVYVGGSQFYPGRTFHGRLDDARIYGFALSSEQILAYHDTGRDVMVSQQTTIGDVWHADVTPFSAAEAGSLCQTNTLTIEEVTAAPVIISTAVTAATVGVAYS